MNQYPSMRRSGLFCNTLRQNPSDADIAGYQLLLRGGFVQPLVSGIFSLLPLGYRVGAKLSQIMREEMDAIGGQEVTLPVVHPAELWQETGRWYKIGPELARFQDRGERDMVLAMTHEEAVTDLLRKNIHSYRQLPVMIYQLQTKFRDEPRPRGGLLRTREFTMKDGYSCHTTYEDLDRYYEEVSAAYFNIFRRSGIKVVSVSADVGMMGGTGAHEFMFLSEIGEDTLVICDNCGYSANQQVATFRKEAGEPEEQLPLAEVETPGAETIASLAEFLKIPESKTAKATFFMAGDTLVFAVVRGDMDVNETKLANAVGAPNLRPAAAEELHAAGIVAGYASPIGVKSTKVVVDDVVERSSNLVAGANKAGFHLRNTNHGRDYQADIVTDIADTPEGAGCPHCGSPLRLERGIEVGNIFKLGTDFSEPLGARYLDANGELQPIVMGSYGIGLGRLLSTIAHAHHDDNGLRWPVAVTPFHVYLVGLELQRPEVSEAVDKLFTTLSENGVEVLLDDREERAGVKFNDADLLGMPLRLTVSPRTVEKHQVEVKDRRSGEMTMVGLDEAVEVVKAELGRLRAEDAQAAAA